MRQSEKTAMHARAQGFTLVEILIVVAILGIIAAIALPSFSDATDRGRRSDGQSALMDLAAKMETYYYSNKTYTQDLREMGYTVADNAPSAEQNYTLTVLAPTAACAITSCYILQATAVGAQVGDGNLGLNSAGQKTPADKW